MLNMYYVISTGTRLKNIPKDLARTDENKVSVEPNVKSLDKTPHNLEHNEFPREQLSLKMNSELKVTKHRRKKKLHGNQKITQLTRFTSREKMTQNSERDFTEIKIFNRRSHRLREGHISKEWDDLEEITKKK